MGTDLYLYITEMPVCFATMAATKMMNIGPNPDYPP